MADLSKCKYHHTATRRGYISRKCTQGIIKPYKGRYGTGYIKLVPRFDTTRYVYVSYYIEEVMV